MDRSKLSRLLQFLKALVKPSLILDVFSVEIFNVFRFVQSANVLSRAYKSGVLKLDISIDVRLEHPSNIIFRFVTFAVLNPERSTDFSFAHL